MIGQPGTEARPEHLADPPEHGCMPIQRAWRILRIERDQTGEVFQHPGEVHEDFPLTRMAVVEL